MFVSTNLTVYITVEIFNTCHKTTSEIKDTRHIIMCFKKQIFIIQ